jgi:ferredoxin
MAPEIFEMDPLTEKAVVTCDECPEDAALLARAYCPHDCIEVD